MKLPPKRKKIETVDDLVIACDFATICHDLKITPFAVHLWRENGVPGRHWKYFIRRGVTAEELYEITRQAGK